MRLARLARAWRQERALPLDHFFPRKGGRGCLIAKRLCNKIQQYLLVGVSATYAMGGTVSAFRDRIREFRRVSARDLLANPRNWRTHPKAQQEALRGILAEVGYADALLARETDDGRLVLVDGHLRAETTPDQEVPVLILDVTEAEADKLLLSLDPLAELADTNAKALESLLRDVQTGDSGLAKMWESLAEQNGLLEDGETSVTEVDVKPPPQMAWVLIGVPVVRFGDIQTSLDRIAEVPEVTVMSTANDTRAED